MLLCGSAEKRSSRLRADQVARSCRLPNGAERMEIYGLDGKVHRVEEPDGTTLGFRYAVDGSLRLVEHSSGERVEYENLAEPRRIRAANARTETTIEFDEHGFPAKVVQRVDDFEWTVGYERDSVGRVGACLYPQAAEWLSTYTRDTADGMVSRFSTDSRLYFDISMAAGVFTITFADGTSSRQTAGQIDHLDARKTVSVSSVLTFGENRRLDRWGDHYFEYDAAGRLAAFRRGSESRRYEYDALGRLTAVKTQTAKTALHYAGQVTPIGIGDAAVTYDSMGRRVACGETGYRYNLYGQLTEVTRPDGRSVHYLYDGFGRLVGRECGGERVHYIVDFDGHRIAEADADGRVVRSYLWLGDACVGAIDGVVGEPLAQSFHRGVSGRVAAIGSPEGTLRPLDWSDPYGCDSLDRPRIPAIASLFPDADTRLYHAGSRWFDPQTAQFLTPDGWFGTDYWNHMPPAMRRVFDALPGGTSLTETPQAAYVWCHYDPINFADPNGHNVVGEVFGFLYYIISFFLWQMQVTSIALQMAAVNFVIMLIPSIVDAIWSAAEGVPMWGVNIFNAIPPLVASSRLMVWAFPLNSLYNAPGTVFTMGSVIWMRGSQNRGLLASEKRDILVCNNAAEYSAFTESVASDVFAVPRPAIKGTGTMNPAADAITAAALDPGLGGGAIADFFHVPPHAAGDPIGVRIGAAGRPEFPNIVHIAGGTITLSQALPAAFRGAAVEFFRLDQPLVKIEKDGKTLARSITFVRGNCIHFQNPLPADFPDSGLKASEYLFKPERQFESFLANEEFLLIEFPAGAAVDSYAASDFIRILSGNRYFGRQVVRKQGATNIVLDSKLDPGATPLDPRVEVVVMAPTAEAAVVNQTADGDRVTVGAIRTLRKHDGLLITFAGAPGVESRHIVLQTFLRCAVNNPLPAALQGKAVKVDLLLADVPRANGKSTAADTVTTDKDEAGQFQKDQPVRITNGAGKEFNTTVKLVTAAAETIQLAENLPAADFPVNTAVTVVSLKAFKTLDADAGPAPAGGADQTIDVKSDDLAVPVADEPLLVRPANGNDPPVFRRVKGDPVVVARLDSALPHMNSLTVRVFSPDAARKNTGTVKKVILRLTSTGATPFGVSDEIYCADGTEEYIGKVYSVVPPPSRDIILEDPIFTGNFGGGASFSVAAVEPAGHQTDDASLTDSLILIPSDPDEEPVTRARAISLHEMRHVWQYAVLGPFFFSQPLPWLIDLGFQMAGDGAAHAANKVTKWTSLGILDKLFSVIAWGIAKGPGATTVAGTVATRKRIDIDQSVNLDTIRKFEDGDPVEVTIGDAAFNSVYNIVDRVAAAERRFDLRFDLGDEYPVGSTVSVSVSPFERINSQVTKYFSLNFAQIWGDYIPSSWGRTLNSFLNRESWFPLLGLYPITLFRAGLDQRRMYLEQDASFQSGDIYTSFGVSYPNEIYVGQYSRVIAFIYARGAGDLATGISRQGKNITRILTVETPAPPPGKSAADLVPGSVAAGGNEVRFRKELLLPMNERIENAVGAMFVANTEGEYKILSWDEFSGRGFIMDDMVGGTSLLPPFIPFFPTSFHELRRVKVKKLGVDREYTVADPLFETESHRFVITGAEGVTYTIAYKGAAPAPAGAIDGLKFTAPRVAANVTHHLQVSCTYPPDHGIFQASGKAHGKIALPAANLTNVCQDLDIVIAPIAVENAGAVKAGETKEFNASIAPRLINRTSPDLAEAVVQARLTSKGGRPAKLTFLAPNKVNAAVDVVFRLTFGTAPNDKQIDVTIHVEP